MRSSKNASRATTQPDSAHVQAAAAREHPATHPVFRAADVRSYFRQRHRVTANLERNACETQHVPHSHGLLSPDCTQTARLSVSRQLLICNATSGEVLQQWSLPAVPTSFCPRESWAWDPAGHHLTLLFGHRWWQMCLSSSGDGEIEDGEDDETGGLVFFDCKSGASTVVVLPQQDYLYASFSPSSGFVAVCHLSDSQEPVISVFDCDGALVACTPNPEPPPGRRTSSSPLHGARRVRPCCCKGHMSSNRCGRGTSPWRRRRRS